MNKDDKFEKVHMAFADMINKVEGNPWFFVLNSFDSLMTIDNEIKLVLQYKSNSAFFDKFECFIPIYSDTKSEIQIFFRHLFKLLEMVKYVEENDGRTEKHNVLDAYIRYCSYHR